MKQTSKKVLIFAAILVGIVIALILATKSCSTDAAENSTPTANQQDPGLMTDPNAAEGGLAYRSPEEIQEELNAKVALGMINISMNLSPVFADGRAKGDLHIVNNECNNYPQIVYIVRKDTGEEIYRSGGIPVGSRIEYAPLDVDLDPGVYECVAYFNNADPDTGAILGTAGAEITVTVKS